MNGFELVPKIRELYSKEDIAIIGLSSSDRNVSARFLKLGANDFLSKDFIKEEFYARITQNLRNVRLVQRLRSIAMTDHLTGLFNRRFFFEEAKKQIAQAKRQKSNVFVAMMDIDFFKKVNDTYGHQIGDEVLVDFSSRIKHSVSSKLTGCVAARFGGEEFVILCAGLSDASEFVGALEEFRTDVEENPVDCGSVTVPYTVSIGIALSDTSDYLDAMIKNADNSLYEAKENGRNQIIINK
jgi:diguanylate cyclase (GGDEF)-like protein